VPPGVQVKSAADAAKATVAFLAKAKAARA